MHIHTYIRSTLRTNTSASAGLCHSVYIDNRHFSIFISSMNMYGFNIARKSIPMISKIAYVRRPQRNSFSSLDCWYNKKMPLASSLNVYKSIWRKQYFGLGWLFSLLSSQLFRINVANYSNKRYDDKKKNSISPHWFWILSTKNNIHNVEQPIWKYGATIYESYEFEMLHAATFFHYELDIITWYILEIRQCGRFGRLVPRVKVKIPH